jgi:hypothetical protein
MDVANYVWMVVFILVVVGMAALLRKKPRLTEGVYSFLDRITVLAGFYVLIDIVCIIVIVIRNVT